MPKTYNRIVDEHLHTLITQGNHEALIRLRKRYQTNIVSLSCEMLSRFQNTGIQHKELISLCEDNFNYIVRNYDPQLSSFFYFWKDVTTNTIMDYIQENSYRAGAKMFNGLFSLNSEYDDGREYSDIISESDEETFKRRLAKEMEAFIDHFASIFTKDELALLSLAMNGYTLAEMEKGNMMSRSEIHLTFKSAIKKIQNLMKNLGINID